VCVLISYGVQNRNIKNTASAYLGLTERDVSAFFNENSPDIWTNVRQFHFCVCCNILSTVSYLKGNRAPSTSKHMLVRVTGMCNVQKHVHKSHSSTEQL
jgi:hypothetical protein